MLNGKVINSNAEYHQGEGFSRSDLMTIRNQSYAHYEYKKNNPIEPTPAMEFGTQFHQLILEPTKFYDWNLTDLNKPEMPTFGRSKVDLQAKEDWRNTVYHGWEKSIEGKTLIKKEIWDKLHAMKDCLFNNPIMFKILTSPETIYETSWYCEDGGLQVKCRTDIYSPEHNLIIDLKTTQDASFASFRRDIGNYLYHVQSFMYSKILKKINKGDAPQFIFACVEKTAPHGVALYKLDDGSLDCAEEIYNQALKMAKHGTNESYPSVIQDINLPAWCFDVGSL